MSTAISTLTFEDTDFAVIDWQGQKWLRGSQIGYALGYQHPRQKIHNLYKNHSDEFTDSMTMIFTQETEGGPQETRMFSLRGAHLLAMFAKTDRAKAFRVWVLDLIEGAGNTDQLRDWLTESHTQLMALEPRYAKLKLYIERDIGLHVAAKLARLSPASAEVAVSQMYLCGLLRN